MAVFSATTLAMVVPQLPDPMIVTLKGSRDNGCNDTVDSDFLMGKFTLKFFNLFGEAIVLGLDFVVVVVVFDLAVIRFVEDLCSIEYEVLEYVSNGLLYLITFIFFNK